MTNLEFDTARSNYVEAEALFRLSLDASFDRLLSIAKAVAVRNAALDRYIETIGRQSVNKPNAA